MPDKPWKIAERNVAAFLTGDRANRVPLSGSTSKHTAADIIHPRLFVEVRYRANLVVATWFREIVPRAHKEGKLPVLVMQEKYGKTRYYTVQEQDAEAFAFELLRSRGWEFDET